MSEIVRSTGLSQRGFPTSEWFHQMKHAISFENIHETKIRVSHLPTYFIQWNVWTKKKKKKYCIHVDCRQSSVGIRGKSCRFIWFERVPTITTIRNQKAHNGVACETGNAVERFLHPFCIPHIYTKVKMDINLQHSKCESSTGWMKKK